MTGINGLLAFAGILVFVFCGKCLDKTIKLLVAFATGALLGGAFFHFIPESFELGFLKVVLLVITGILLFTLLEKLLHWHHCHNGKCKKHQFTYLLL